MKSAAKITLIASAIAIALPQVVDAQTAALSKAWDGTWRLDTDESKFSSAEFTPKSDTRIYSVTGRRVTMHASGIDAAGKKLTWRYSANTDGKWYETSGNPNTDHVALTFVSPHEFKSKSKLNGKPTASSTVTVSADGKVLTIHRSILTAKSGPTDDTLVFHHTK